MYLAYDINVRHTAADVLRVLGDNAKFCGYRESDAGKFHARSSHETLSVKNRALAVAETSF